MINSPSWDADGNTFKEWKNSVALLCLQARGGGFGGVYTTFHHSKAVPAWKVWVAAHSPLWSCRSLCTSVTLEQSEEDKMASQQLCLRLLGLCLLLLALQGELSSFRLPLSRFPLKIILFPLFTCNSALGGQFCAELGAVGPVVIPEKTKFRELSGITRD